MRMKEVLTLRGSCLSLHVEVVDLYRRQAEETIPHRGRNEMSSTEPVEKTWVDAIGSWLLFVFVFIVVFFCFFCTPPLCPKPWMRCTVTLTYKSNSRSNPSYLKSTFPFETNGNATIRSSPLNKTHKNLLHVFFLCEKYYTTYILSTSFQHALNFCTRNGKCEHKSQKIHGRNPHQPIVPPSHDGVSKAQSYVKRQATKSQRDNLFRPRHL